MGSTRTHDHARVRIDLVQLDRNVRVVRNRVGSALKLLFPVKADEYGHGTREIARRAVAAGVDGLGVGSVFEARRLRKEGIDAPVLILSPVPLSQAEAVTGVDAAAAVSSVVLARALADAAKRASRRIRVHIKVDTGLGRDGVPVGHAPQLVEEVHRFRPWLVAEGVFSHLSVSDSTAPEDQRFTRAQIQRFGTLLDQLAAARRLPPLRHVGNTAGLVQHESLVTSGRLNMVRPGILLYGYPELRRPWTDPIRPILRLVTWISVLKEVGPGAHVGYGRSHRTDSVRRIATLPVGYSDGIPSGLGRGGSVTVRGRRAPVVGAVSMDQFAVDVTDIPGVQVGEEAEIIGPSRPADALAHELDMGLTEVLLTGISPHLTRTFTDLGGTSLPPQEPVPPDHSSRS